jgi:hypothetical protein
MKGRVEDCETDIVEASPVFSGSLNELGDSPVVRLGRSDDDRTIDTL